MEKPVTEANDDIMQAPPKDAELDAHFDLNEVLGLSDDGSVKESSDEVADFIEEAAKIKEKGGDKGAKETSAADDAAEPAAESAKPGDKHEEREESKTKGEQEQTTEVKSREQELEETIEALRRQVSEVAAEHGKVAAEPPAKPAESLAPAPAPVVDVAKQTVKQVTQQAMGLYQWLADDDVDTLMDPKKMNTLLNQVYAKARNDATEHSMLGVPDIVRNQVAAQMRMQQLFVDFWKDNDDLKPFSDLVEVRANKIGAANPNFTVEKLLEETAADVRNRLRLPDVKGKQGEKGKPAFAKPGSVKATRPVPQPVDFDAEFSDLLEG